ncbi:hypothetical protein CTAYLR_006359 [Chrysophaeum taylorii]|uniref:Cation-transporting P-type ATPase N-terminal domain-containing protein n=1 Tax=Chrysophaeum taylorii TaxID=2483200 RepID=A0AAD7U6P3_9STRA|nr:hypothetical protein CTAYLR_006359 [Chrysophaeum taylorii]
MMLFWVVGVEGKAMPGAKFQEFGRRVRALVGRQGGYISSGGSVSTQEPVPREEPARRPHRVAPPQWASPPPETSVTSMLLAARVAHSWTAAEALLKLDASVEEGLSADEARSRRSEWGRNELVETPRKSKWMMLWEQFDDRLVQILVVVAVGSAVLGVLERDDPTAWVDPVVICAILISNAAVGVWQEASADDSLEALKKLQPDVCCCKRGGEWDGELSAGELVPGDVVYLRVGDKVPADVRLLQLKASSFSTDEAALTGESLTVQKSIEPVEGGADVPLSRRGSMAFAGTVVTAGHAVGVVVATGMATEIGRIQAGVAAARAERQKTPLTLKLDEFASQLTAVIATVCAATFLASIPRFDSAVFGGNAIRGALFYAKSAIALGVAAIPEGLPAVITLCLSLGTRRMAARRVVVRRLPSVETLGCTTVICSDKTGTLTTNQMTVMALLTPGATPVARATALEESLSYPLPTIAAAPVERRVTGSGYDPTDGGVVNDDGTLLERDAACRDVAAVCALCNDARITFDDQARAFSRVGEPTEAALKVLCEKLGVPEALARHRPSTTPAPVSWRRASDAWATAYERVATLEFDRARKSMSVVARPRGATPGRARLLVKGAPDSVLRRCVSVRDPHTGATRPLSAAERRLWEARCRDMASRPLRCLALATRDDLPDDLRAFAASTPPPGGGTPAIPDCLKDAAAHELVETQLSLVGVVGIRDPPRPEAGRAIKRCRDAGIRVFMITGDSRETALAIASELGILDDPSRAFEGAAFFKDDDADDRRAALLAPHLGNAVFCRTAPADKQRIIKLLASYHGDVTAMTGDGVNDAPALQQAAIGVAMGITGTEVAKEASDMVLMDDDFASIVSAVEEGRTIYKNMQAFVCFLLSCNFGEVFTIFGATVLGIPDVLTPLQLLWVNLVTDGPPATALGFNPPDPAAMSRPPRNATAPVLTPWLATRYAITGAYVGFATIRVFLDHYARAGVDFKAMANWATCDPKSPDWADFVSTMTHTPADLWAAFASRVGRSSPGGVDACALAFSSGGTLKPEAQTLALTTLVAIEMLKALGAVSLDHSLLRVPFWRNQYLLAGVALPVSLHLALLYTPPLRSLFGLVPLTVEDWHTVLAAAAPIILVEEILKAVGRYFDERALRKQRHSNDDDDHR